MKAQNVTIIELKQSRTVSQYLQQFYNSLYIILPNENDKSRQKDLNGKLATYNTKKHKPLFYCKTFVTLMITS